VLPRLATTFTVLQHDPSLWICVVIVLVVFRRHVLVRSSPMRKFSRHKPANFHENTTTVESALGTHYPLVYSVAMGGSGHRHAD